MMQKHSCMLTGTLLLSTTSILWADATAHAILMCSKSWDYLVCFLRIALWTFEHTGNGVHVCGTHKAVRHLLVSRLCQQHDLPDAGQQVVQWLMKYNCIILQQFKLRTVYVLLNAHLVRRCAHNSDVLCCKQWGIHKWDFEGGERLDN